MLYSLSQKASNVLGSNVLYKFLLEMRMNCPLCSSFYNLFSFGINYYKAFLGKESHVHIMEIEICEIINAFYYFPIFLY